MKVSAVVISHGHADELVHSLPALDPQVDELLVIANIPGSLPPDLPPGVRVLENAQPLSFAANANLGAAHTEHGLVLIANPDAIPEPDAVEVLRAFVEGRPRAGVAGPQMLYSDGTWQASRRSFPTVGATLVRRTPLRLLGDREVREQRRRLPRIGDNGRPARDGTRSAKQGHAKIGQSHLLRNAWRTRR